MPPSQPRGFQTLRSPFNSAEKCSGSARISPWTRHHGRNSRTASATATTTGNREGTSAMDIWGDAKRGGVSQGRRERPSTGQHRIAFLSRGRKDSLPLLSCGDAVRQNDHHWTGDGSSRHKPRRLGGGAAAKDCGRDLRPPRARETQSSSQVRWYRKHGASGQMELACRSSTMRRTSVPLSERNGNHDARP
jgi:hypothetical protein